MSTRFLTEAELRAIYGDSAVTRLASGHGGAGVIETKIQDAEDEAMGFIRGYTDIPATPETASRRLKVLVAALAYYNLHSYLTARPFTVRDERDNAIAGLKQIRSGELSIASASEPDVDLARPAVLVSRRSVYDEEVISLANMRSWGRR